MAKGRKKQEIAEGYVKERFIVDLVLKEDDLSAISKVGKTKYITDLVSKDLNVVREETEHYGLTVTEEIRERFNNDPRRAYLLGQLLTEYYCEVESKPQNVKLMVENKVEPLVENFKEDFEKEDFEKEDFEIESIKELSLTEDVEVEEKIKIDNSIENSNIIANVEIEKEEVEINESIFEEKIEEINKEEVEHKIHKQDRPGGRFGDVNSLMKRKISGKDINKK